LFQLRNMWSAGSQSIVAHRQVKSVGILCQVAVRVTARTVALIFVLLGASSGLAFAAYDDYLETFDGWPDSTSSTGCGVDGPRPAECNGSFIWRGASVEDFGTNFCHSGSRCWKGVFAGEEAIASFSPKNGTSPSSTEVYIRFYGKFQVPTAQCSSGLATAHKMGRVFSPDLSLQLIGCRFLLEVPVLGLRKCSLSGFRVDDFFDQWVKIEWWMQVSNGDAQCQIWATEPDGTVHTVSDSWSGQGSFGSEMWIMGNKGNSGAYTIYMDDICIGNSIDDRTGFCAEIRPNPPILTTIQ